MAGQIQLALFPNPGGLNAVGHNMYTPTDASGDPTIASPGGPEGLGTLQQGYVEQSNVSVVTEFVNMIVAQRSTKTGRTSSASSSITGLAGVTKSTGALANLVNLSGSTAVNGQGTTSRDITFSTTLTARVTHVLPNGYMVVEGSKDIDVNSEKQAITVRGVVRPVDVSTGNIVRSDHLGQLEVRLNGKGVVGDAIRRPFILYRMLMGILPL